MKTCITSLGRLSRLAVLPALALSLTMPAHAATYAASSAAEFRDECGSCLLARPEARSGGGGKTGDWEIAATPGFQERQYSWESGRTVQYRIKYNAAKRMLVFRVGNQKSRMNIDLDSANVIYLRARAQSGGSTRLRGRGYEAFADGTGMTTRSGGTVDWVRISDFFNPSGNFQIKGALTFDFGTAANTRGNRFGIQARIGSIEEDEAVAEIFDPVETFTAPDIFEQPLAVPLPASGLLLLGALGAAAAGLRRRKR